MYLRRNSFYLKGQVSKISRLLSHQVAPAAQSPAWRQPLKKVRDIQTYWEYPEQQAEMEGVTANMPPPGGAAIPDGSQPVIPAEPWYPRDVDVQDVAVADLVAAPHRPPVDARGGRPRDPLGAGAAAQLSATPATAAAAPTTTAVAVPMPSSPAAGGGASGGGEGKHRGRKDILAEARRGIHIL